MPATAYCSLSRSPPGPWPGHYSSVQFICYFCSYFTCILYYVYLLLLAIGPNKVFLIPDLTRFNKIAIHGTPQMAVDKEAIICLSRVSSYYFKCNFPLFYV